VYSEKEIIGYSALISLVLTLIIQVDLLTSLVVFMVMFLMIAAGLYSQDRHERGIK
jgi:hypothetical protein